ncbi:DNA-processing protein DprA [Staphylococcus chromogenes]|uniref:DNA-processing protein DprA n=1 Tax=Staphylococcus chromogenes TaxID=46126 RepID=UPI0021D297E5|nr:DNA-processing protein DprA [Staphylococcus chromogenes]UXS74829.1 DNA-processing protein DprA [Staphylococcus chromogenes]
MHYAGFTTNQIYQLFTSPVKSLQFEITPILKNHPLIHQKSHFYKKFLAFQSLDIDIIQSQLEAHRIVPLPIIDARFPSLLKEIYHPPLLLYCKGNLNLFNDACYYPLAVVGARDFTAYGERAVEYLLHQMKHQPIVIVSGLAKGTDALAHHYALCNNIATIAVLGFGHFHHYPKHTQTLRTHIDKYAGGLSISEYPPTTAPAKFRFPERNRIISGLSKGVLVTEAKERSGALITLDQALEQNRNVYVLPGDMFNPDTKGNLLRVKEGAEIVLSAEDILKDMNTSIQ